LEAIAHLDHSSFLEKFMDLDRDDPDSKKLLDTLKRSILTEHWPSSCPFK